MPRAAKIECCVKDAAPRAFFGVEARSFFVLRVTWSMSSKGYGLGE